MLNDSKNLASPEQRLPEAGKRSLVGDPVAAAEPDKKAAVQAPGRTPAIIVTSIVAAVAGLTMWYLVQPQPLNHSR